MNILSEIRKLFANKWFLLILGIKVIASFLFAADVFVKGFAPFITYFVSSGFDNPYDYFASIGQLKAFPYPSVMLALLAIPRILLAPLFSLSINFLALFILRIPVLLADILIYFVLNRLLEGKEKSILLFYWASPILFYINYFHGQLDVIPTAILFLSVWLLLKKRELLSFVLLGIGLATKTHLIVALPLYCVYLFVNKAGTKKILQSLLVPLIIYLALTLSYLFSHGYIEMVLHSAEQAKLFLVSFPYAYENIRFLLAPGAVLLLMCYFFTYPKINQDMLIFILGLVFSVLVMLVPPMPGWFYWSIPFLTYFYIRNKEAPHINFWLLNIAYIAYFALQPDANIAQSFQLISPAFASQLASSIEYINTDLLSNILFTVLEVAMFMNVFWCYKVGIKSNFLYKLKEQPLLIGIGGDSGAGKTSFAQLLEELFGKQNSICVNGDDVHKWSRGHEKWSIFTHLNPKSNHLHTELRHAVALKHGKYIERVHYDHDTGTFTNPQHMEPNKFILFVGLHTYYIEKMRGMFDVKIFLDPDESLRQHWKIVRDIKERGYSKEKVMNQLKQREADSQKYIKPQREKADIVISYVPTNPIQDIGALDVDVPVKLVIYCENSLHIDPLLEAFQAIASMQVESFYQDDLKTQRLEFVGTISAQQISDIALTLIPSLKELLNNDTPKWESDYKGLSELFVAYYLHDISQFRDNTTFQNKVFF